ncbi:hypothetical protein MYAM1_004075 [Malassezia yamatoensis]|uniref:BZIP domain-containing protein n=1 Tax=Malassezia yamatoensis TaxID=253288 RepID=A0AAJ5YWX7_9BASI|nr:hypothetical protein MYAM1_004075 [Malassezia yamatoensis]
MLRNAPARMRRARFQEDEVVSSPPMLAGEDEENLLSDFWRDFDQNKFLQELNSYTHHAQTTHTTDVSNLMIPALSTPLGSSGTSNKLHSETLCETPTIPPEFYGQVIQILTFVLGSNPPMLADFSEGDRSTEQLSQPYDHVQDLTAEDWKTMHNVVTLIMEHFGSETPMPSTLVSTQELTRLLQKLMAKQQETQTSKSTTDIIQSPFAYTPTQDAVRQFLNTEYTEEEDEDDPEFLPTVDDPTLSPAWRQALQDLTSTPLPPLGSTTDAMQPPGKQRGKEALNSVQQNSHPTPHPTTFPTVLDTDPTASSTTELTTTALEPMRPDFPDSDNIRRGRRPMYTAEQARERKRERNRQHMRMKRSSERANHLRATSEDAMIRDAEIQFLREELERLREENARLRGREEMRQYAANMGLPTNFSL